MNNLPGKPIVYLITKGDADTANFSHKKKEILETIRVATELGISLIQIREKNLTARSLFELTESASEITRTYGTKLLVNDRADIAIAAGANGVHLPAAGLAAEIIRKNFPRGFLIGVSTHSIEEASNAAANGADFVTFGPVFESPGKGKPTGLGTLNDVCKSLDPFPVIALGGIDESNFIEVLENGAKGFAAIRFLNDEGNLRKLLGRDR